MNVNVEKLIAQSAENGWDFFKSMLDGPQPRAGSVSPEQMARAEKVAAAWATFYASESGRAAIEHLIEITIERPCHVVQLGLPMDQAYGHGAMREGQNGIVETILRMIAEGRKENVLRREDEPREDKHEDDFGTDVARPAVAIATGGGRRGRNGKRGGKRRR